MKRLMYLFALFSVLMLSSCSNDLDSSSTEDMEAARKQADKMLEFSNKLIDEVAEFAKDSVDQEGWATSLLMGLARATSVVIRGLEKASDNSDSGLMKHYVTHVLPLCDLVTQRHETRVEEAMANMDTN